MTHPKLDARGNFEVITAERQRAEPGKVIVTALAGLFFLICTWTSYARWANFQYRSFDLAYYVQAIWQLIHGRLDVSVENVPLLGNHVEPIVFLFAPLFAVFRHPMLFVIVQNAALATMPLVGYNIAKRLGLDGKRACLLSAALLLAPAAGYIAIHEFHPEALVAPFLLLMLQAWVAKSISRHWLWFVAVLACKENMAPLLIVYCATQCVVERSRGLAELRRWFLWPMGLALIWFVLSAYVITPALNSGNIDYVALYDQLGTSPGNILLNAIVRPQLIGRALLQSLTHGNLVWGLLLPFLCLPLLRPRWIVIAAPILAAASSFLALVGMDDLLSLRRAAPSSLLDRIGRSNRSFRSKETCSFVRFARSRMAGHYRLCRRPDLDRAGLAHRHYDCGLV